MRDLFFDAIVLARRKARIGYDAGHLRPFVDFARWLLDRDLLAENEYRNLFGALATFGIVPRKHALGDGSIVYGLDGLAHLAKMLQTGLCPPALDPNHLNNALNKLHALPNVKIQSADNRLKVETSQLLAMHWVGHLAVCNLRAFNEEFCGGEGNAAVAKFAAAISDLLLRSHLWLVASSNAGMHGGQTIRTTVADADNVRLLINALCMRKSRETVQMYDPAGASVREHNAAKAQWEAVCSQSVQDLPPWQLLVRIAQQLPTGASQTERERRKRVAGIVTGCLNPPRAHSARHQRISRPPKLDRGICLDLAESFALCEEWDDDCAWDDPHREPPTLEQLSVSTDELVDMDESSVLELPSEVSENESLVAGGYAEAAQLNAAITTPCDRKALTWAECVAITNALRTKNLPSKEQSASGSADDASLDNCAALLEVMLTTGLSRNQIVGLDVRQCRDTESALAEAQGFALYLDPVDCISSTEWSYALCAFRTNTTPKADYTGWSQALYPSANVGCCYLPLRQTTRDWLLQSTPADREACYRHLDILARRILGGHIRGDLIRKIEYRARGHLETHLSAVDLHWLTAGHWSTPTEHRYVNLSCSDLSARVRLTTLRYLQAIHEAPPIKDFDLPELPCTGTMQMRWGSPKAFRLDVVARVIRTVQHECEAAVRTHANQKDKRELPSLKRRLATAIALVGQLGAMGRARPPHKIRELPNGLWATADKRTVHGRTERISAPLPMLAELTWLQTELGRKYRGHFLLRRPTSLAAYKDGICELFGVDKMPQGELFDWPRHSAITWLYAAGMDSMMIEAAAEHRCNTVDRHAPYAVGSISADLHSIASNLNDLIMHQPVSARWQPAKREPLTESQARPEPTRDTHNEYGDMPPAALAALQEMRQISDTSSAPPSPHEVGLPYLRRIARFVLARLRLTATTVVTRVIRERTQLEFAEYGTSDCYFRSAWNQFLDLAKIENINIEKGCRYPASKEQRLRDRRRTNRIGKDCEQYHHMLNQLRSFRDDSICSLRMDTAATWNEEKLAIAYSTIVADLVLSPIFCPRPLQLVSLPKENFVFVKEGCFLYLSDASNTGNVIPWWYCGKALPILRKIVNDHFLSNGSTIFGSVNTNSIMKVLKNEPGCKNLTKNLLELNIQLYNANLISDPIMTQVYSQKDPVKQASTASLTGFLGQKEHESKQQNDKTQHANHKLNSAEDEFEANRASVEDQLRAAVDVALEADIDKASNQEFRTLVRKMLRMKQGSTDAERAWQSQLLLEWLSDSFLSSSGTSSVSRGLSILAEWGAKEVARRQASSVANDLYAFRPWIIKIFSEIDRVNTAYMRNILKSFDSIYRSNVRYKMEGLIAHLQENGVIDIDYASVISTNRINKEILSSRKIELVSPEEIQKIRDEIVNNFASSSPDKRDFWMTVYLLFSFGVNFGLRSHEVLTLSVFDVSFREEARDDGSAIRIPMTIRVAKSKTLAGKGRVIDIDSLMPQRWKEDLHRIFELRMIESDRHRDKSCCISDDPVWFPLAPITKTDQYGSETMISGERLWNISSIERTTLNAKYVRPLRELMQRITGRPVTYHDLRHTFAANLLCRLTGFVVGDPSLSGTEIPTFEAQFVGAPSQTLHKLISDDPCISSADYDRVRARGARTMWVVAARIMGHLSPYTTATTYCHVFHFLVRVMYPPDKWD